MTPGTDDPSVEAWRNSPALVQLRPPFVLRKTPLPVPRYTVSGAEGATATVFPGPPSGPCGSPHRSPPPSRRGSCVAGRGHGRGAARWCRHRHGRDRSRGRRRQERRAGCRRRCAAAAPCPSPCLLDQRLDDRLELFAIDRLIAIARDRSSAADAEERKRSRRHTRHSYANMTSTMLNVKVDTHMYVPPERDGVSGRGNVRGRTRQAGQRSRARQPGNVACLTRSRYRGGRTRTCNPGIAKPGPTGRVRSEPRRPSERDRSSTSFVVHVPGVS